MWNFLWAINFLITLISAKRYPYLQFRIQGEKTAISGIQPWLQQHVSRPQECLLICVKHPLKCTYIQYGPTLSDPSQWLCQLFDDIQDLSRYLVSKLNSVLYSAVHENHHCSDMKNQLGYTDDGLYYITFNRNRKQVFCDMAMVVVGLSFKDGLMVLRTSIEIGKNIKMGLVVLKENIGLETMLFTN